MFSFPWCICLSGQLLRKSSGANTIWLAVEPALGVRAYRSASKGAIKTKTPWLYPIILYNTETDRGKKSGSSGISLTHRLARHHSKTKSTDYRKERMWNYDNVSLILKQKSGKAVQFSSVLLHLISHILSLVHRGLIQWEPTVTIREMFIEFPFLWGNYFCMFAN